MNLDLFRSKIDQRGTDECWPWTGATNGYGYGLWSVKRGGERRTYVASRLAWELTNGPISNGLHVLHHCDYPACCNPVHLFLGTPLDNARDKVNKGRLRYGDARGVKNGHAKLTEKAVLAIRAEVAKGWQWGIQSQLARQFGVSPQVINDIVKRRTWRHI